MEFLVAGGKLDFKMSKVIKIILIFFGIILLIGLLFNYLGRKQLSKLGEVIPPEKLSQIQSISPEEILKPEEGEREYKEFISPNGELKMKYPSDWIEIKDEVLEKIIPKEYGKRYELKILFSAQKFKMGGEFAQIIVSRGNFEAGISFDEILEEMKESNRQQGWNMEIIKLEIEVNIAIFEAKYQKLDRYDTYSKEKILLGEEKEGKRKVYLIAFVTFEKDWAGFEKEADEIIQSIQLVL